MSAEELPDGGWSTTEKGWVLHPSQAARVRQLNAEKSAALDVKNERAPKCALCGQRTWAPDKFGLCSKVSPSHRAWRTESAADLKAGVR